MIHPIPLAQMLAISSLGDPKKMLTLKPQMPPINATALMAPDELVRTVEESKQTVQTSAAELGSNPDLPTINPDTRVLHIGDSHTVGIYGKEMDKLMRSTGAKVETYGSAGSSPSWWWNGTTTRSGYYGKDEEGKVDRPKDWRTPRKTPIFKDLIGKFKPNVIVISLGANLIRAKGETIESQVHKIAQIAQESGAKIIWVGPPDGRESKKPTSRQAALYEHLEKAASQYGTFIDSRPYTEYPAKGGDGLHYWGKEGSRIAKEWTAKVFEDIQQLP